MTDLPPGAPSRASFADAIRAFQPYLPYTIVIAALFGPRLGADVDACKALLFAGALLVNPTLGSRQGGAQ